jgi:hypothetical protein
MRQVSTVIIVVESNFDSIDVRLSHLNAGGARIVTIELINASVAGGNMLAYAVLDWKRLWGRARHEGWTGKNKGPSHNGIEPCLHGGGAGNRIASITP